MVPGPARRARTAILRRIRLDRTRRRVASAAAQWPGRRSSTSTARLPSTLPSRCRVGHRSRHSGRRRHRPRTHLLEVGTEKPRRGRHRCRPPDDWGSLLAGVVGARNCSRHRFLVLQILDSGGKTASNWIGAGIGVAVFTSLIGALCCLCPHQRSQSERICRYAVLRRHGPRPTRLLFPRIPAAPRGFFMCADAIRA